MNLLLLYEAAKKYAGEHNHPITVTYMQEYLSDLYSMHLPLKLAEKIIQAHTAWESSDLTPETYTVLVVDTLKEHLLTVD